MYGLKAVYLYNLLKERGVIGAKGNIRLELMGAEVNVNDTSAVGNLLQEWVGRWMDQNGIFNRRDHNTQAFPDFYLSNDNKADLLEVKTFNYPDSPNFDVAQFDAYVRSLRTKAYKLDTDYLIFGYSLSNGVIEINGIWLKKIWEITCASAKYALRTQVKQLKIHNIRPYNFKSMSRGYQPFTSRLEFVEAIKETLAKYLKDSNFADDWLNEVNQSYKTIPEKQL